MSSLLVDALRNENKGRPPVWLMRQAGRYMPAYQELRKKYSLKTLFFTPELASDITLMPVEMLGVDAAILFSDISVVALSLGLKLDFSEGPRVDPMVTPGHALTSDLGALDPIIETIQMTIPRLKVPLIGFCGAPFTVASYLANEVWESLLEKICDVTIGYIKRQVDAGITALQIFDSWANVLSKEDFLRYCLPFYRKMIAETKVPVILFLRGIASHLDELKDLPCALSLDWQMPLSTARQKTPQVLQGNLDPDLLFSPMPVIKEKAQELIDSMQGDPGFIAGLGHGVKPGTPFDAVKTLVQTLQGG